MKLAFGDLDCHVVDARLSTQHQSLVVKLPEFIAVSPKPLPVGVVVLVLKANRDPVVGETPQ